jgi:hypothetical protein
LPPSVQVYGDTPPVAVTGTDIGAPALIGFVGQLPPNCNGPAIIVRVHLKVAVAFKASVAVRSMGTVPMFA